MERRELALSDGHVSNTAATEDPMQLPPGFRFHPTDEELITHYLSQKVVDSAFNAQPIGEVDLNKCEPWELPRYPNLREDELYFFCVRDRKYPTGLRTNRATSAGYWKATGKDKEIYRMKLLVGMKKTLVFYRGRAPRGEKTNWVMHEYRLEGKCAIKNDWVLCRIFKKSSVGNGKKGYGEQMEAAPPPNIPPLADFQAHVTCFSNAPEGQSAPDPDLFTDVSSVFFSKFMPVSSSLYGGSFMSLLDGYGFEARPACRKEREMLSISQETGLTTDINPEICSGDKFGRNSLERCLWNC